MFSYLIVNFSLNIEKCHISVYNEKIKVAPEKIKVLEKKKSDILFPTSPQKKRKKKFKLF